MIHKKDRSMETLSKTGATERLEEFLIWWRKFKDLQKPFQIDFLCGIDFLYGIMWNRAGKCRKRVL